MIWRSLWDLAEVYLRSTKYLWCKLLVVNFAINLHHRCLRGSYINLLEASWNIFLEIAKWFEKKNWCEIVPLYWDWTRLMIMMSNRTSLVFLSIWYFLLWIDLVFLFDLVDKSNKGKDTINPLQLFEKGQFFNHNNQWLNNIYH